MIGYIGLLYGFLVDTIFMDEKFTWLELTGAMIILITNILVIACKKKAQENDSK